MLLHSKTSKYNIYNIDTSLLQEEFNSMHIQ